ncbi:Uu.00g055940.m01.CDS01 [Anthostomella pinea]|uniref:Uu.00g055940.m01.CDS01 n=1 Tax=Anthostomella pinea TaxID=933095 RepID=A0AAI8VWX3_9PEZI|nr:Uu.00g055940.m01.CDS01 [Anthostomella pinea]
MAVYTLILGLLAPLVILGVIRLIRPSAQAINFPPGPPSVPLLGNLHQVPPKKSFLELAELNRTYGSRGLMGLRLGPSANVVVLSSWKAVRDLVDQRGAIYSSRPYVPLVEYVVPPPGDIHLVFTPYGPKWRKGRKTVTDFLKDSEVDKLLPIQDAESSQLMFELLQDPKRYYDHIPRCFGAVITASVFGTRGMDYSDTAIVKRFFDVQGEWAGMLGDGSFPPFDVFPFLRYVPDVLLTPWRGWRKRAESLKQRQNGLYRELLSGVRERVAKGQSQHCFLAGLLQHREKDGYSDVELEYIGGLLMEGGSDTTAAVFETFVLAMAAFPQLQKRAQKEADAFFGHDKMSSDEKPSSENLPFLKACFLESLRWRPSFPMNIPHATSQDDTYEGFFIPAGTTVLMNIWAIHHDPDEYEDADSFDPSRFLKHPLGLRANVDEEAKMPETRGLRRPSYGFGAGRRVCPGQRMAENSLLMAMVKLLWSFDIVALPGPGQLDTSVLSGFRDAILTGPKHFGVDYVVRSEAKKKAIAQEWARADGFLKQYE